MMTDLPDDGVIISLDSFRHARKKPPGTAGCKHPRTVIDERGGTVQCRDCDAYLSAFIVLLQCAREENSWTRRLAAMKAEAAQLAAWTPFLRTMRELEKLWRGRKHLPVCPHCRHGLWPSELTGARHSVGYETMCRQRDRVAIPVSATTPPPPTPPAAKCGG